MARVPHDSGYKLLFSHVEMVRDLLKGFVREDWVEALDLGSLERVSGTFVADGLRDREGDVIWRVRWGSRWLYVYLLIEFQSTVEPHMAVRIMTYVGLLYQDLERQEKIKATDRLPPVLPIVLYNGQARWSAATDVGELVEPMPGGLARYCPRQRYLLLDEGRVDEREPLAMRNLVAALFRLEKSREPSEVREMVGALGTWLHAPEQIGLRRAFTVWIKRVLLPGRLPGVRVPEVTDLQEVESMLAERVVEWTEQWKREGLEQGLEQGRREMLGKLIEGKFGALPEWARERLAQGKQGELVKWAERLFEAGSLEEVFG